MPNTSVIADNKVVLIHYTLKDDSGEELDSSQSGDPLVYLHGAGNIVPGLEQALTGQAEGAHLEVVVEAKDGYGEKLGPGPQAVPRADFPADIEISAGMAFMAEGEGGEPLTIWVVDVHDGQVLIDANHPLSGVTLHFDIDVVTVRDATEEELSHGHPHGPDGHSPHH